MAAPRAAATAAQHRDRRLQQLRHPTHRVVVDLATDELLSAMAIPSGTKNSKLYLEAEVARLLKKAYDMRSVPAEVRDGSTLLRRLRALQTKKGLEDHQAEWRVMKQALRELPAADLAAVVPLNLTLINEFRPHAAESVCSWICRVNGRIASQHVSKQNRSQRAAKGELKEQQAGAGVLQQAFEGKHGKGARTSEFASSMVKWQSDSKLPAETATKAVSRRTEPCAAAVNHVAR
jgi:hypothetical protein